MYILLEQRLSLVKTTPCFRYEGKTGQERNWLFLRRSLWITISIERASDETLSLVWCCHLVYLKNNQIMLSPHFTFRTKTGVELHKTGLGLLETGVSFYWIYRLMTWAKCEIHVSTVIGNRFSFVQWPQKIVVATSGLRPSLSLFHLPAMSLVAVCQIEGALGSFIFAKVAIISAPPHLAYEASDGRCFTRGKNILCWFWTDVSFLYRFTNSVNDIGLW